MSKIDDLIAKYCPNGLEYKTIGSLVKRIRDKARQHTNIQDVYAVSNTQGLVLSDDYHSHKIHSEDTSNYYVLRKNMFAYNPARLNIGSIAYMKSETPGLVSPMYVVFEPNETIIDSEYLFLQIKSTRIQQKISSMTEVGARFRFDYENWNKIIIPVPPLPIQKEIVTTLNTFISLEAELEAELVARKKQYEHYRDKLLNFADISQGGVRQMALCEVVDILDSQRRPVTKGDRVAGKYPYYGANGIQDYVDNYIFDGTFLLVGEDGSVINKDNSPVLNWASGKIWVNNHAHILKEKPEIASLRYLYFFLSTTDVSGIVRGTPPKLNQQNLKNIQIPVPSLAEQERIVSILDKFDALVNDISDGLPAEINARRQQYEYYRDKLLNFEPMAA